MISRYVCRVILASLCLVVFTASFASAVDEVEKAKDRYQVPDGDVDELVKYLNGLQAYRPKTTDEILAYRQNALKALTTAAERIIKLEKDPKSKHYRKANSLLLQLQLNGVARAKPKAQEQLYKDILAHIVAAETPARDDLALAFTFGQVLEESGSLELAKRAYTEFGKTFEPHSDTELAAYGEKMTGIARRLGLPGEKMKISGTTAAGDDFDWKSYRGKVVLVDYWATWCGPCIQELPNVKENYEKYHKQGFEVVGISLDSDPARLGDFLKEREIPWTTLFEEGAGWDHPMAKYYGVMGIPQTMLLDRDGKVIAMGVYGGELGRQLATLFDNAETPVGGSE